MATIRAQVILKTVDNVAENFVSNSWAFDCPTPADAPDLLTPLIEDFYSTLRGYLSPVIAQNNHTVKYSVLPGTPPNYPFEEDTFNLTTAPSGTALPDEVAVCLSFQGSRGAGFPQARRRGRIYFGPLATVAATGNRPATALLTLMGTTALTLMTDVNALGAGYGWVVWSPTDGSAVEVTNGWIDNAFDTQRRRGVDYTSRTVFGTP